MEERGEGVEIKASDFLTITQGRGDEMKDIIAKMKVFPEISIKEALRKIDDVGTEILYWNTH